MAFTLTTLKNSNLETIIHFHSVGVETGTISLNTLGNANQFLSKQTVSITADGTNVVTITHSGSPYSSMVGSYSPNMTLYKSGSTIFGGGTTATVTAVTPGSSSTSLTLDKTVTSGTQTGITLTYVNGTVPTVNIVKFAITGALTSKLLITRNSKVVVASAPENAPVFDLNGLLVCGNSVENTSDIVLDNKVAVDVTGYIVLRKVAGWENFPQYPQYGSYASDTKVGPSAVDGAPKSAF